MNLPTLIWRHRRENLKKCSLHGLEKHSALRFYTYPEQALPDLTGYLLLQVGAPPLTEADRDKGLLLLDGTWRLAKIMEGQIPTKHLPTTRSLPLSIETVYPRRQTECPDPLRGLASVEALYLAHLLLGKPTEGLLDHYFWRAPFLAKCAASISLV